MTKEQKRKRMEKMVKKMADYWATYADQQYYIDQPDKTFLDDALYAIGVSLDEKNYMYANGFRRFKQFLKDNLNNEPS